MYKSMIALALCSALGACAAAPATVDSRPAASSSPVKSAKRMVCVQEQVEDTGTRLGGRKVCHPAEETEGAKEPSGSR